ncbi:MAG TPA: hypothetical protein VL991_13990 [Terracidiphilus sp.]|nr:hypothetical protein [Terracidiphilus sp.]
MAVSRTMRRLLRVLTLEEEQRQSALESAVGELRRFERALDLTAERERAGRRLLTASAASEGEIIDRVAALEEMQAAKQRAAALRPWIQEAEEAVAELLDAYIAKRVERRQADTLLESMEAARTLEDARRSQQSLDDWYLNRQHRKASARTGNAKH